MRSTRFDWQVAGPAPGRVDAWLSKRDEPKLSRSAWKRLILGRHVRVNGQPASPDQSLRPGDQIAVDLPPPEKSDLEPEQIPLEVLFEDEDLVVVNKPAGLVVHPGAGHRHHTLVHALLHHCAGRLSGVGGVERPGLVHRIDADTSGCLVVAKNDSAHVSLAAQFKNRSVEKIYLACVWGEPRQSSGRVETTLGRHPTQRKKMAVVNHGKPALLEWKLRERLGPVSLLECKLLTGRTHQIRVQCAHLRHAIVGDKVYGSVRSQLPANLPWPARHLLHAWRLGFQHPRTAKRVTAEAPVPADMAAFLEALRRQR
jgi:23S rRNA pseudouridine1911/1915/1917 synthase